MRRDGHSPGHIAPRFARGTAFSMGLMLLIACSSSGLAQEAEAQNKTSPMPEASTDRAPQEPEDLTVEQVEAFRKEVEAAKDLDEATRTKINEFLRQAVDELQKAAAFQSQAVQYQTDAAQAQERAETLQQQLQQARRKPEPQPPESATLSELEQQLESKKAKLAEITKKQSELIGTAQRAERRKTIRTRLFEIPEKLAEVNRQLQAAPEEQPALLATARRMALRARRQRLQAEKVALESELAKYDAEDAVDLVRLRRELLSQQIAGAQQAVEALQQRVNRMRRQQAADVVQEARRQKALAHPVLKKSLAARNEYYAQQLQEFTAAFEEAQRELQRVNDLQKELEQQSQSVKQQVENVGLTVPIGLKLRAQRTSDTLQAALRRHDELNQHARQTDDVLFELLRYEELRSRLSDYLDSEDRNILEDLRARLQGTANRQAQVMARGVKPQLPPEERRELARSLAQLSGDEREAVQEAARELMQQRLEYIDKLISRLNEYFNTLLKLHTAERGLVTLARNYADYIDERVLWIRSTQPLSLAAVHDDEEFRNWFLSGRRWNAVGRVFWNDLTANFLFYASAALAFATLMYLRSRFRRELKEIAAQARRGTTYRFAPTLRAAFITGVLAIIGPGLVWYFGWRLALASDDNPVAGSVADALLVLTGLYFPLELVQQSCRSHGLAGAHFGWPERAVSLLRRSVRWLILLGLPVVFVTTVMHSYETGPGDDAAERVVFTLAMLLLAVFLRQVLHPVRGCLQEWIGYHRGGWIDRLKPVWSGLAVAVPLILAGLAVSGYYYTAIQLSWRLLWTLWITLGLVFAKALLNRWVLLRRRRLSIEQARERRAALQEEGTGTAETAAGPDASIPTMASAKAEARTTDIAAISTQTQRLIGITLMLLFLVGLGAIWLEVLPALGALDRWVIWGEGTETPVTVVDLALAVFAGILTAVAARNVPGLLEISVLSRLPLDASIRYALTRIASYTIVLVGVIVGFTTLGLTWDKVQWLAAAVTVGLGFGLQEIFANFVSGLIILFERPMRVGDVVTIGDVTGWVSRIRIRATTITRFDRRELIVPNKEFITGQLLNWTLSNSVYRPEVTVGIAYGSDINKARDLMVQIAKEHPLVLNDPPPLINFEAFGDSTLNVVMRPYFPDLENLLPTLHELNTTIHDEFRKAGIEIAFPQRDLHLRSFPAAMQIPGGNGRSPGTPDEPAQPKEIS